MKKILIYSLPLFVGYFIATIWGFSTCDDGLGCGIFFMLDTFSLTISIPIYAGLVFIPLYFKENNKETKLIKKASKIIALSLIIIVGTLLVISWQLE